VAGNPNKPISPEQKKYIRDLCEKRDLTNLDPGKAEFLKDLSDENLDRLNGHQASNAIGALLALPKKPLDQTGEATKPESKPREGYFFIVDPTNGEERFFRVNYGKEGTRWEGYTFLDVQASDYFYPIKDAKHREAVFAEIMKDQVKAMNEYGLRLGRCGVCNRTLTDRHSILRGIGPICASRLEATPTQLAMIDAIMKRKAEKNTTEEGGE